MTTQLSHCFQRFLSLLNVTITLTALHNIHSCSTHVEQTSPGNLSMVNTNSTLPAHSSLLLTEAPQENSNSCNLVQYKYNVIEMN